MTAHATVDTMVASRRGSRCHQQRAPGSACKEYAGCVVVVRRIGGFGVLMLGVTKGGELLIGGDVSGTTLRDSRQLRCGLLRRQRTRARSLIRLQALCDKTRAIRSDLELLTCAAVDSYLLGPLTLAVVSLQPTACPPRPSFPSLTRTSLAEHRTPARPHGTVALLDEPSSCT